LAFSDRGKRKHFIFSFIAILIAFATFVVKDDLRDGAQEFVASMDAAESTFIIRAECQRIFDATRKSPQTIDLIHEREGGADSTWFDNSNYDFDVIKAAIDEAQGTEVTLDNIRRLLEAMPNDAKANLEESQLEMRIKALNDSWHAFSSLDEKRSEARKQGDVIRELELKQQASDKGENVIDESTYLVNEIDRLAFYTLHRAEDSRRKARESLRVWTILSYVVYGAAGLFGLIGLLFGIEVKTE
jgi:hypothetical protein